MVSIDSLVEEFSKKMDSVVLFLGRELAGIRTGRSSVSLLDGITVECYSQKSPLNQVATVTAPDAQTLKIEPWDKSVMGAVEKAILGSDLGLTPNNDGKVIRIPIPPLTQDRRKELCKIVRKMGENSKLAARNLRRDGIEKLKVLEKEKEISSDFLKSGQDKMQKILDLHIGKIDKLVAEKETDIEGK